MAEREQGEDKQTDDLAGRETDHGLQGIPDQEPDLSLIDPDLRAFVEDLQKQGSELLQRIRQFLKQPHKTKHELVLGIYLDVVFKEQVLGVDPFAPRSPDDQEHQDDRFAVAFIAAESVARQWLIEHPHSQSARDITELSVYAPRLSHYGFLREIWLSLPERIRVDINTVATDSD